MTTLSPSREDAAPWLRLTLVPGVSGRAQRELLARFGSPAAALSASASAIREAIGEPAARALAHGAEGALLDATLAWLSGGAQRGLVTLADADYPKPLLEADDPPCVLYAQGRRELLNLPAIAIVGSRNATPQGMRDAEAFARALSDAGLCIVSGLARGIDAAAHRGGLAGASGTIAVMGTGPDRIYPAANRELAHRIAERGCLITEFPLGTPSAAGNFPRRNRIISGLSRGVLVVEAAVASGSLITARLAGEQGRDVFAVPGSIHSALSKGCHELIRQGAKLAEGANDVLLELGIARERTAATPSADEHPLLQKMGFAPVSIDQMADRTGLGAGALSVQLSQLELDGRIEALAGGWFQRVDKPQ